MDAKIKFIIRRLASLSLTLGAISLILSFLLSLSHSPATAAGSGAGRISSANLQGIGDCDGGYVHKDEFAENQTSFTYSSSFTINRVFIKAGSQNQGQACFGFLANGSDGCYQVSGLQSKVVTVSKVGSGPECKDISHVEFYYDTPCCTPPPQPTDPPTAVPTTAVPTTAVPTTAVVTTEAPTQVVTTEIATTEPPVTQVVTTVAPTTAVPTTAVSTTTVPETIIPPTIVTPTTTVPTTAVPATATPGETIIPQVPTVTSTPTFTSTPTQQVQGPVPTLAPPAETTPRFNQPELIPVTGADHLLSLPRGVLPQQIFLNLGVGLLGVALVLFGIARKFQ